MMAVGCNGPKGDGQKTSSADSDSIKPSDTWLSFGSSNDTIDLGTIEIQEDYLSKELNEIIDNEDRERREARKKKADELLEYEPIVESVVKEIKLIHIKEAEDTLIFEKFLDERCAELGFHGLPTVRDLEECDLNHSVIVNYLNYGITCTTELERLFQEYEEIKLEKKDKENVDEDQNYFMKILEEYKQMLWRETH